MKRLWRNISELRERVSIRRSLSQYQIALIKTTKKVRNRKSRVEKKSEQIERNFNWKLSFDVSQISKNRLKLTVFLNWLQRTGSISHILPRKKIWSSVVSKIFASPRNFFSVNIIKAIRYELLFLCFKCTKNMAKNKRFWLGYKLMN